MARAGAECGGSAPSGRPRRLTLDVHTTTGTTFALTADARCSVDHLKKLVSRRLKVPKERICLLHRERQLRDGTLEDNGLIDGSRIILLPSVETGLLTQRPENSVMQALESLNDSQVNDFLSGKSPLNLTMRLGDHMMLIQLQLSTFPGGNATSSSSSGGKSRGSSAAHRSPAKPAASARPSEAPPRARRPAAISGTSRSANEPRAIPPESAPGRSSDGRPTETSEAPDVEDLKPFLCKQDIETLQSAFEIFKSLAEMQKDMTKDRDDSKRESEPGPDASDPDPEETRSRSPARSPSNPVSDSRSPVVDDGNEAAEKEDGPPPPKYVPLPSSLENNLIDRLVEDQKDAEGDEGELRPECPAMTDPIAANLTSCLCSTLDSRYDCSAEKSARGDDDAVASTSKGAFENCPEKTVNLKVSKDPPGDRPPKQSKNKRLHYLLHKTSKPNNQNIPNKPRAFMQSLVSKHIKKRNQMNNPNPESYDSSRPSTSRSNPPRSARAEDGRSENPEDFPDSPADYEEMDATDAFDPAPDPSAKSDPAQMSDANSLVEASKNLTQTLKKLSKEVLTNKVDLTNEETLRPKIGQGAVIESMKHHGKGIYSGTFSGTLNPALQDRFGRPKRDISTIIHILNDLLCATPPQYRRGARITFEPTHTQSAVHHRQREFRNPSNSCAAEQNGADECGCNKCSNNLNMCPYGECNGHYTSPQPSSDSILAPLDVCTCKRSDAEDAGRSTDTCTCSSESPSCSSISTRKCHVCDKQKDVNYDNRSCRKCNSANTLALDNSKTKCKLDQLRLVMQQKKQRREARKMKSAPYPTSAPGNVNITQTDQSNVITEEIETVA